MSSSSVREGQQHQQEQEQRVNHKENKDMKEEMMAHVSAFEAALLPCLHAREFLVVNRSVRSSNQIDVERHAVDFMEAAKKIQLYFIALQREEQPTKEETLRKDMFILEQEVKTKSELIDKQEKLISGWRNVVKAQLDKHVAELERV